MMTVVGFGAMDRTMPTRPTPPEGLENLHANQDDIGQLAWNWNPRNRVRTSNAVAGVRG